MSKTSGLRHHRTLFLIGFGGLLAIVVAASTTRVPEGAVGVLRGRLLGPGWHVCIPFAPVRIVPLRGRLEAVDLSRRTAEGAEIVIRTAFDYDIDAQRLAPRAPDLGRHGVADLARAVAGEALEPLPLAELMPPADARRPRGRMPVSASATGLLVRALRDAGLRPEHLTARAGARESFADDAEPAAMPRQEPTGLRLLLIGLDGADWDVIDPLLAAGRLPNLARLIATGVRAPLRSYDPMISPLLWTTVVTGVGPDVHGVADFQAISEKAGRRVPISSRFRRVKALWNIFSDAGVATAFAGWWASYPTEQVEGFEVSNLAVFETLRPRAPGTARPPGIAFPADYFDSVVPATRTAAALTYEEVRPILKIGRAEFEAGVREVLKPPVAGDDAANRRMAQQPVPLAIAILTGTHNYATIAADLAGRRLPLTAVYFEGIDMIGHRFQHCMPPRMNLCPDEDYVRFSAAVDGFCERQDQELGRVLDAAGPGTTVMVISDHGFRTGSDRPADLLPFTTQQPVEWHDQDGVLILSGPGAGRGRRPFLRATLYDIAPTLLYLAGLPVSEEMPGRVLEEALEPEFERAHPVRTIRSYERVGGRPVIAGADGPGAQAAEEELLANLRALGYIGGDAGGPSPVSAGAGVPSSAGPPASEPPAGGAEGTGDTGADTQVFYHRNLATYLMKRKDYAGAVEQLRLANERQKLPKNYQMLSEALLALGRTAEAVAALEEGLETIEAMDAETVLWLARIHLGGAGGRPAAEAAARRWADRSAKTPGLGEAIAGLLLEDAGDAAGARAAYRRSLAADPTRVVAAERLYALEDPGARAAALEPFLRRGLAKDPRIDEHHNLLGIILAEQGRRAEAIEEFRRAVAIDPDNPRFAGNLAGALVRAGRWEEAAAAYEQATALAPVPVTYMKLGSVYRELRRPDLALAAFQRARSLGDEGSAPLLGMALARAEMGQVPEALSVAQEGLGRHPDDRALRSLYEDLLRRTRTPGSAPGRPGSDR